MQKNNDKPAPKRRGRIRLRTLLWIAPLLLIALVAAVPQARWRVHVLVLHATGAIPDIELNDLITYMLPGSDQTLTFLIDTRNPYSVIKNFHASPADVVSGGQLFRQECGSCHGPDGSGGPAAPALRSASFKHGQSDWALYRTIRGGVPSTAMQPHPLGDLKLWQVIAFIRSVDSTAGAAAVGKMTAENVELSAEALAATRAPAEDWLTYSGSYDSARHSSLTQISAQNVHNLGVRWIHQIEGNPDPVKCSAIVRNGTMFVTIPPNRVLALDASTGRKIWAYQWQTVSGSASGEFGVPINRGVALLGNQVFVGTGDARVIALDAATGRERWQTQIANHESYYVSGAPLAYRDLVVTGVGTKGGRGFVVALDVATGKERWRFVTIPGPGERGNDTWANDSWKEGGAPTWLTGSYDVERDLLLWGVGNPKPDYNAAIRAGDNLYSNSVIALRGTTGQLVWHFQFTPADDHDWDSNQIPIFRDRGDEHLLLWANRNGFYYVLNRDTGQFLNASPFVHQTWTQGVDEKSGRPIPLSTARSTAPAGFTMYPGNVGGTNWWSPTYVPDLDLMIVPVLEQGMVYFTSAASTPAGNNRAFYTAVRALDARTGKLAWEYVRPPRTSDNSMGGLLSTSTGLVFGSDQSTFFALDARKGTPLWTVETGGNIAAAPVTYAAHGEQFVFIPAGRNLMAFAFSPDVNPTPMPAVPPLQARTHTRAQK